jgi:ParB family chromosome partitioning protein
MAKDKGLGKGFGSLLPDTFDRSLLIDEKDRVQKLFISDIVANPDQPRRHFDEDAINELANSIRQFGILQPLVVTPENDKYIIIAGERRFRAAQKAGLKNVPALVRTSKELERLEIGLVENVQRVDLSPLEQAVSIARLHEQFNISYQDIAKRLAKAHTTVINIVRLLQLPELAREALSKRQITEGHGRAILALRDFPAAQKQLLDSIMKSGWSVRQAEQFVTAFKAKGGANQKAAKKRMETSTAETKQLGNKLGARVNITRTAKGGRLQIAFGSDEELQRILSELL